MAESGKNLRRSSRIKVSVKYTVDGEDEVGERREERLRRSRFLGPDEKELEEIEEDRERPTELFTEGDVNGECIYGFQTPSERDASTRKSILAKAATTPQTPRRRIALQTITENTKTPHHIRIKKKKELVSISRKKFSSGLTSSESESVSDDSEYVPSDDKDEESEDEEIEELNENSDHEETIRSNLKLPPKNSHVTVSASTSKVRSKNAVNYDDYHLKSDEYFESQSEKILTSDRTLGRLANPRLDEKKLQELLANQSYVSAAHKKCIYSLSQSYKALFHMWNFIMEEGYSLLLHGLGSKRDLIASFHREIIADHPTLVVNGFFPSLTIKEILDGIIVDLLGMDSPGNMNDCLDLIDKVLRDNPDDRLYLLIHNIDGATLRANKTQNILSNLASIPNLYLMASVDHINAPLVWDDVKRSRYNFYWWDATTLLPYEAETSYESSLLVQQTGALALSSLQNVFLSLTSNARAIYLLLVKEQLENASNNSYPGMAFKDLYRGAREAFLVSSDLALRGQLTEFLDHKLVKSKRNIDGVEYLVIPLDNSLLRQFLDQHDES